MKTAVKCLLASCVICVFASNASAQNQVRRYQPSRPTVSPYLNLLRRDVGPLPNYQALVLPQVQQYSFNNQQRQINQNQQIENRRTESGLNSLGKAVLKLERPNISPTGTGATFMNYSHYYGGNAGIGGGGPQR